MATNSELITRAFKKIGYGSELESGQIDDALPDFKNMIWELEANVGPLGYSDESLIGDETDLAREINSAVIAMFAKRLAETFSVMVSQGLEMQSRAGLAAIMKLTSFTPELIHPNRMPRGSGLDRRGIDRRYYREEAQTRTVDGANSVADTYNLTTG